jgi:hypothetical protein
MEQASDVLESTASINPTSLVKILRDFHKDSLPKDPDDKTPKDKTPKGKGTDPDPVRKPQPVNAEYASLTTDEFSGTVGRCLNDMIRRLNDGWEPSPDELSTLKKQVRKIGEQLSDIKPKKGLDKFLGKKAAKA